MQEKLYRFYNNIGQIPSCPVCGNPVKFHGYLYGYAKYCCPTCAQSVEEVRDKQRKTFTKLYGDLTCIAEKGKQTKLKRYGDPNYNNVDKMKQTCLKKYGTTNIQSLDFIRKKVEQTNLKKYGAVNAISSKEYLENKKKEYFEQISKKYPEVIELIYEPEKSYLCKCCDPSCDLCQKKQFIISRSLHYQRTHIFHTELCPIKNNPEYAQGRASNIEMFVRKILDDYNIEYICNDRKILHKKELDIYIPSKNIAFECNGIYWHSDKKLDKKYHVQKLLLCKSAGIKLITLWEDWIINNPESIKSLILKELELVPKSNQNNIEIKEVDKNESKKFHDKNSFLMNNKFEVSLGIYKNKELISIMYLKQIDDKWIITEYCEKLFNYIDCGFELLIEYFKNHYKFDHIEYDCLNDIDDGLKYEKIGFVKKSTTLRCIYITDCLKNIKRSYNKPKKHYYHLIHDSGVTKYILCND